MVDGMKLMIAVPCLDYIDTDFIKCLFALTRRLDREGLDFDVRLRNGSLVYWARDDLSFEAMQKGYTHVLWLDSDIIFDDDILEKLAAAKKGFVSGVYRCRRGEYKYALYKNLEPAENVERLEDVVFRIDGCGFGAVLIETRILKDVWDHNGETCFAPTQRFGEDMQFCMRARALGHPIWCQPAAQVGHVGRVVVRPDEPRALKEYQNVR